jgi:hypothetical protein
MELAARLTVAAAELTVFVAGPMVVEANSSMFLAELGFLQRFAESEVPKNLRRRHRK